jgi:hypothetical protein
MLKNDLEFLWLLGTCFLPRPIQFQFGFCFIVLVNKTILNILDEQSGGYRTYLAPHTSFTCQHGQVVVITAPLPPSLIPPPPMSTDTSIRWSLPLYLKTKGSTFQINSLFWYCSCLYIYIFYFTRPIISTNDCKSVDILIDYHEFDFLVCSFSYQFALSVCPFALAFTALDLCLIAFDFLMCLLLSQMHLFPLHIISVTSVAYCSGSLFICYGSLLFHHWLFLIYFWLFIDHSFWLLMFQCWLILHNHSFSQSCN